MLLKSAPCCGAVDWAAAADGAVAELKAINGIRKKSGSSKTGKRLVLTGAG